MPDLTYEFEGFCSVCELEVTFRSTSRLYRDNLRCSNCSSMVRERALALALNETIPGWREIDIHESSPAEQGISAKIKSEANRYTASHFFPDKLLGSYTGEFRNENLEKQTFADASFDLVVTLDVMEHVFDPRAVYNEIYRTLRPGGHYIHTFPISKSQTTDAVRRAQRLQDGSIDYLDKPVYHGNPIDTSGSLVTFVYGYEISRLIAEWAPFDVRIVRFWDAGHGIIGDYTEVIICRKRQTK